MVRPRIPDHLLTEKQRKNRERNDRRRTNTNTSNAVKLELNDTEKLNKKGEGTEMGSASIFPNNQTTNHYLNEQKKQAQTLSDIQTRLAELNKLPALDQTVSNLTEKFDQYFEQHESNTATQTNHSSNFSGWGKFVQKCSSVTGTSFLLAIVFLFSLLAAFGTKSLIDAGFEKNLAIAGSTVCELLAVIFGVMYATSKDWFSKTLSCGLLLALTAVLCFFSYESTIQDNKPKIEYSSEVLLAKAEHEDAREAYKKALQNHQNTEPKYKSAREVHKEFLDELESKKILALNTLKKAQAKIEPKPASGIQILETALRIIGTLALAILTHRFINYLKA